MKKNNKQKTRKHFSDGPCGTIAPGTNPRLSQGQTGQNGDFTVELNRERPVCPRDGSHFVPGRGPICPRDGSCLSRTPSRRKCLCLLVFFLPDSGLKIPIPDLALCSQRGAQVEKPFSGARLRGRTLRRGVVGNFWKCPSRNPF